MKTPSMNDMTRRIARFEQLEPLPIQQDRSIPLEALDMVYARELLPVLGNESEVDTPISVGAPILGASGITITLAVCPPGQGPDLHAHKATHETFTVMQGRFEFRWGVKGEHKTTLDTFDVISVPPGAYRAFQNVGEEQGILQVIISGGVHDMNDICMPEDVAEKLQDISPELFQRLAVSGISFEKTHDHIS